MFENTRDHFFQNVLPAYKGFFEARFKNEFGVNDLVRHATVAATALYHMREHFDPELETTALVGACPDYALVRDICDASKHNELDRKSAAVSKASQIFEIAAVTEYRDERGEYRCSQVEALVRLNNSAERKLAEILYNVMGMWCERLRTLGIISTMPDPKVPEPPLVEAHVPRDVAEKKSLPMRINQGEEWRSQLRIQRFNYERLAPEAVVFPPGTKMEFRIYKPIENVAVDMTLVPGEPPTSFDIPLTPDQAVEYMCLKSDDEKAAYMKKMFESDPLLQKGIVEKYFSEHPHLLGKASEES